MHATMPCTCRPKDGRIGTGRWRGLRSCLQPRYIRSERWLQHDQNLLLTDRGAKKLHSLLNQTVR